MSPLPFFGRVNLAELASQFTLTSYVPVLTLQGLMPGVDNLRTDVFLSPRFTEIARAHLSRLIEQHGGVKQLKEAPKSNPYGDSRYGRAHIKYDALPEQDIDYPAEFKRCLAGLQIASLRRAREADDMQLDLLCRVGLVKFLRAELLSQFTQVQDRCQKNLRLREGTGLRDQQILLQDRFARFKANKRQILRGVAADVLSTLKQVERETVESTRHSLFGDRNQAAYEVIANRLLFQDSAQDPVFRAEHYALFGTSERDPDYFERVVGLAQSFLRNIGLAADEAEAEALLNVPENAKLLMFSGLSDESPRGKAQRALTTAWMSMLEEAGTMDYAGAAYEAAPILGDYGAVVASQQLKTALISKSELLRVAEVLETHNHLPSARLNTAAQRLRAAGASERLRYAARYFIDLLRFHRDVRKMDVLERALESVNLLSNARLRELSEINGTLYEYLLPEEERPAEERVKDHVVLKADIRGSTFLTRSMLERGLNPASFFSLNFFEPVNKLLPRYGAEKVFIEGDAVILTLLEKEGEHGFGVARTCALAREMLNIVQAYNVASTENGLPPLEIGTGISYQNSAPLYLMDGSHRVMISDALNLSDRLSACHKRARAHLKGTNPIFNVFIFQTADEEAVAGALEDFMLTYNVGGIHLPRAAFDKLRDEISLAEFEMDLPMPWGNDTVRLFRGLVPVSPGVFHPVLVREGRAAQVQLRDFQFVRWADHLYYEVCTNAELIETVESQRFGPSTS